MSTEEEIAVQALLEAVEMLRQEAMEAGLNFTASGITVAVNNVKELLSDV